MLEKQHLYTSWYTFLKDLPNNQSLIYKGRVFRKVFFVSLSDANKERNLYADLGIFVVNFQTSSSVNPKTQFLQCVPLLTSYLVYQKIIFFKGNLLVI